jgi:Plasmid pRiA4b ORF-3-like protein
MSESPPMNLGYWFDFGDDWWHQINVAAIDDKVPRGKYPKVVKRVGKSPPQYLDEEE